MTRPAPKVRRGDHIGVRVRRHDLTPEHCALWRAVRVARDGKVTHVVPPEEWTRSRSQAGAGNTFRHRFVDRVFVGVPRDPRLEALEGERYRDQDALVAAM